MIFLTVLKIIGIVLACIVGFVLLILLLVLFAPFRYSIAAAGEGSEIAGGAKIKWLLGLVTVRADYAEKKAGYSLKVLGIKIFKGTILDLNKSEDDADGSAGEETGSGIETKKHKKSAGARGAGKTKDKKNKEKNNAEEEKDSKNNGSSGEGTERTEQPKACDAGRNKKLSSTGSLHDGEADEHGQPAETEDADSRQSSAGGRLDGKRKAKNEPGTETENEEIPEDKKPSFVQRIKDIAARIKHIYELVQKVKYILGAPVTKRALAKLGHFIAGFFKHIRPRKIKGYLKFGTDDPATTAQVYGISANVAAMIDKRFMIIPYMYGKCFDINILIKGRLFIGYVLISALRVVLNKDVRRVIGYVRRNF